MAAVRLEPFRAVAAGQPQDTEAGAEALLGVRSVAQDDVDEDGGGGTNPARALAQHLRRDLGMPAMAGRHVVVQRRGAHVAGGSAAVTGHALATAEDLDGTGRQARPELLADQIVRHRVMMALEPDMVVWSDRRLAPVGVDEAAGAGFRIVTTPAARATMWQAFSADPEWVKVRTESEKNGALLVSQGGVVSIQLTPTDYSPLK